MISSIPPPSKGRNVKAIFENLVDNRMFAVRFRSVKRFIRRMLARLGRQINSAILTSPDEQPGRTEWAATGLSTGPRRYPI